MSMSPLDGTSQALVREYFDAYPAEAAAALADVPATDALHLIQDATDTGAAAVFERLDPDRAMEIVEAMDASLFQRLWSVIDAGAAAALLARLEPGERQIRLALRTLRDRGWLGPQTSQIHDDNAIQEVR